MSAFGRTLFQRAESRFHHWGVINGANHFAKWTTIIFPVFIKKLKEEENGTFLSVSKDHQKFENLITLVVLGSGQVAPH